MNQNQNLLWWVSPDALLLLSNKLIARVKTGITNWFLCKVWDAKGFRNWPHTDLTCEVVTFELSVRPWPERCNLRSVRRRRNGCDWNLHWMHHNLWIWGKKKANKELPLTKQSQHARRLKAIKEKFPMREQVCQWLIQKPRWSETSADRFPNVIKADAREQLH